MKIMRLNKLYKISYYNNNNITNSEMAETKSSFYDLEVKDSSGAPFKFSDLKGKVVLIVNVASQCGFTPQYEGLEKLYKKYKDQGFVILGFPCNQFGGQEPGTEEEIVQFCSKNYGVSFPIMSKVDVNGDNESPVYALLKSMKSSWGMTRIKWNFEKFLINKDGSVVERYTSFTAPDSFDGAIKKEIDEPVVPS